MKVKLLCGLALSAICSATSIVHAERLARMDVFATGFDNPRGLAFQPNTRRLYVAEAGLGGTTTTEGLCEQAFPPLGPITGGNTGRISVVNRMGERTTLIEGLPSGVTQGFNILGPTDIEFIGDRMYALIAAGCSKGHVDFPNAVMKRVGPYLEHTADLSAYNLDNPQNFPIDEDHDPEGNPSSFKATSEGELIVVEANHSTIDSVAPNGKTTRVADLAEFIQGYDTPVAIDIDALGNVYIGSFGEFPFADGTSVIYKITPRGAISVYAQGFTTLLDMAFAPSGDLYILETSTGNSAEPPFLVRNSGRISRLRDDGTVDVIATGLDFPTAITFGPDGALYISNRGHGMGGESGQGEILRLRIATN